MEDQEQLLPKIIKEAAIKTEPLEELYYNTAAIPEDTFSSLAKVIIAAGFSKNRKARKL